MSPRQLAGVCALLMAASLLSYMGGHARGWNQGVYSMLLVMSWKGDQ